jgi:hypothetical protein
MAQTPRRRPSGLLATAWTTSHDSRRQHRSSGPRRQQAGLKRGDKRPVGQNLPNGGKARDKEAAFVGVSGFQLDKIKAVVDAAEAEPEQFGKLKDDMDRTGRVSGPYKRLQKPEEFYALVESLCPAPRYCELFSRQQRERWDGHGDDAQGAAASLHSSGSGQLKSYEAPVAILRIQ